MTQNTENARPRMTFASKSAQNRPFRIGDLTFWSKRLTGDDELQITEYQALSRLELSRAAKLTAESDLVAQLLTARNRDGLEVTPEWVRAHVGESSALPLFTYLRTGEGLKPGDTFDLRVFDEPIVIDERSFTPRGLTYGEQIRGAQLVERAMPDTVASKADDAPLDDPEAEVNTWGEARAMVQQKLAEARNATSSSTTALAEWLSVRVVSVPLPLPEDGAELVVTDRAPEAITSEWVLQRLTMEDVGLIAQYLASGVIPEEEPEDPNADGAASAAAE